MQDIIPIFTSNFNGSQINSINSRDLHQFLEIGKDFSNWIKNRLEDFTENLDYTRLAKKGEANNATKIEYIITLDTAKHISMLERNAKGKEIRQYFIDFEKNNKVPQLTQREQVLLLAQNLLDSEKENQTLRIENSEKEKVITEFISIEGTKNYTEVAKILHIPPQTFISWLKTSGYICLNRLPKQEFINREYFVIKKTTSELGRKCESYRITPKCFEYFRNKLFDKTSPEELPQWNLSAL